VQELGHDEVGDLVVDGRAEEDDALVEQAREDVVLALAARGALDDGWDEGHGLQHIRCCVPADLAGYPEIRWFDRVARHVIAA